MLNPFPVLFLAPFAYLILRVFIGLLFITFAAGHMVGRHEVAIVFGGRTTKNYCIVGILVIFELICGALFILGLQIQYAAIGVILYCCVMLLFSSRIGSLYFQNSLFYSLVMICAISLLLTGAGPFAYDLPI